MIQTGTCGQGRHHYLCVANCQHKSWCVTHKQETFGDLIHFWQLLKTFPQFLTMFWRPCSWKCLKRAVNQRKRCSVASGFLPLLQPHYPLLAGPRGPPDSSAVNGWMLFGHCLVIQRGPSRVVLHRGKKSSLLFVKQCQVVVQI